MPILQICAGATRPFRWGYSSRRKPVAILCQIELTMGNRNQVFRPALKTLAGYQNPKFNLNALTNKVNVLIFAVYFRSNVLEIMFFIFDDCSGN